MFTLTEFLFIINIDMLFGYLNIFAIEDIQILDVDLRKNIFY